MLGNFVEQKSRSQKSLHEKGQFRQVALVLLELSHVDAGLLRYRIALLHRLITKEAGESNRIADLKGNVKIYKIACFFS